MSRVWVFITLWGQQLSQLSHFWRGSEGLQGNDSLFLPSAGALQGLHAASKATATHGEALWPRVSLTLHARRYQFIYLSNPGHTQL